LHGRRKHLRNVVRKFAKTLARVDIRGGSGNHFLWQAQFLVNLIGRCFQSVLSSFSEAVSFDWCTVIILRGERDISVAWAHLLRQAQKNLEEKSGYETW